MKRKHDEIVETEDKDDDEVKEVKKFSEKVQQQILLLVMDTDTSKPVHCKWLTSNVLEVTATDKSVTIHWTKFCDQVQALPPDLRTPVVYWNFEKATMTIDFSSSSTSVFGSSLWTHMTRCRKVPIDHFSDLIQQKQNDQLARLSPQDQARLFNLCAVLYKFQGTASSPNLKILIDPGDSSTDKIFPAGSLNHAIVCPGPRAIPRESVLIGSSL